MSSGYSSSAIRERIYFGDDMSGVLLYTGSADKEGSLGGLVELGNIDQLRRKKGFYVTGTVRYKAPYDEKVHDGSLY